MPMTTFTFERFRIHYFNLSQINQGTLLVGLRRSNAKRVGPAMEAQKVSFLQNAFI